MKAKVAITAAAVLLSLGALAQGNNPQGNRGFDIPAGDLKAALDAYAAQSGQQIVYRADDVKGLRSKGIQGQVTAEQALQQLLQGTTLKIKRDGDKAVVVFLREVSAADTSENLLDRVVVTGTALHLADLNRTGTRSDADPMTLPQSISTISSELLARQGSGSLSDAVTNVAGVADPGTSGSLTIRGFSAGILKNGTTNSSSDVIATNAPLIAISRIEVIKGPEAIVAGQSAGLGGVVNVITKAPQAARTAEVSVQLASHSRYEVGADLGGAISDDKRFTGRLIVSKLGEGTDDIGLTGGKRQYIAPALGFNNRASGTELVLSYEGNSQDLRNWQQVYFDPKKDVLNRDLKPIVLGENGGVIGSGEARNYSADLTQRLSEDWRLGVKLQRNEADVNLVGGRVGANIGFPWPTIAGIDIFASTESKKDTIKIDLNGEFETGEMIHKLLLAFDREETGIASKAGQGVGMLNAQTGAFVRTLAPAPSTLKPDQDTSARETGVLLMDHMTWGKWVGMAGVRHLTYASDNQLKRTSDSYSATMPSLGLVYRLSPDFSLYGSCSKGFVPNTGLVNFDTKSQVEPARATQSELGAKYLFNARNLAVTAAVFEIEELNKAVSDPTPGRSGFVISIPGLKSTGFDIELSGNLTNQLSARLAYTNLDVAETMREPGANRSTPQFARRQYSGSLSYNFSDGNLGWWLGAGFKARDEAPASNPIAKSAWASPASMRIDLNGGYQAAKWSIIAGIKNVTDQRNYTLESGLSGSGFVEQPRQYYLTGRHSF